MVWSSLPIRHLTAHALLHLAENRPGGISFLVSGQPGLDQEKIALNLARSFLCEKRSGDACDKCHACKRAIKEYHPDLLLFRIKPKKANHSIDDMRVAIEQAQFMPYESDRKVIVVFQADRMEDPSANCLLKILEEPPQHVVFILISDNPSAMLETILSRCRQIRLAPLAPDELTDWLVTHNSVSRDLAEVAARLSEGRPEVALQLTKQKWVDERNDLIDTLSSIRDKRFSDVVTFAKNNSKSREQARDLLTTFLGFVRDGLIIVEGLPESRLFHADREQQLSQLWLGSSSDDMIKRFEVTIDAINRINQNHNTQAVLEHVLRQYL